MIIKMIQQSCMHLFYVNQMVNFADKIRKFLRALPKNSETKNTGFHREIRKERYMSLEKRQQAIDDLRLI